MRTTAFRRNFWLIDGLIGSCFGLWLGRALQLEADSGDYLPNKIIVASLIGVFSYVLALIVGLKVEKYFQIVSFLWISIFGGMLFALNKYVIFFLIENWNYSKSNSVLVYILQSLPERIPSFLFVWVIASFILIFIFLSVRLINFCFERLKINFL